MDLHGSSCRAAVARNLPHKGHAAPSLKYCITPPVLPSRSYSRAAGLVRHSITSGPILRQLREPHGESEVRQLDGESARVAGAGLEQQVGSLDVCGRGEWVRAGSAVQR